MGIRVNSRKAFPIVVFGVMLILAISPAQGQDIQTQKYSLENAPLDLITPVSQAGNASSEANIQTTNGADSCGSNSMVTLGRGYNSLTGCFRGNSVISGPASPPSGNTGLRAQYSLTQIENYTEIRSYLGFTAGSSFNAFGAGGSFNSSYFKEAQLHRYSNYLLVLVTVTNSTEGLKEYVLRKDTLDIARKVSPDNFLTRFGDAFVDSTTSGGRFTALVEFLSEDRSQQEAVRSELKAHVGTWDTSIKFEQSLSSLKKDLVSRVKVFRDGGVGPLPEKEDLIKAALHFPDEVDPSKGGKPVLYSFSVLDYAATSNWPPGLKLPPSLNNQKRMIERLTADQDECETLESDIGYIKEYPAQFVKPNVSDLDRKLSVLEKDLIQVNATANSILEKPLAEIKYPETDFSQVLPLPERFNVPSIPLKIRVQVPTVGWLEYSEKTWAGVTGQGRAIQTFSVATEPHLADLGIKYTARYFCRFAGIRYAEAEDGKPLDVPSAPADCWVNAVSFELTGVRAKYYDVLYAGHFRTYGNSQVAQDGEQVSIGDPNTNQGRDVIEAINVWIAVKPR
jgi:hypothetical protein